MITAYSQEMFGIDHFSKNNHINRLELIISTKVREFQTSKIWKFQKKNYVERFNSDKNWRAHNNCKQKRGDL